VERQLKVHGIPLILSNTLPFAGNSLKEATMALKGVLIDELRDMYSAENQLVKALPKLAKGAKNPEKKLLFTAHFEETKG
jgi:Domain of unknown function (DUF892)